MFKKLPIITTESLVLREVQETDKEAYFNYVSDKETKAQFHFNYDKEKSDVRVDELVKRYQGENDVPKVWAITNKKTNQLMGIITLFPTSGINRFVELTWGIIEKERGKGY